ncbi:permease [Brevibacillus sp. B_LB10_24]|uniref:permease n=1 Tax=Brevibacillus sp. B_LB10_24 TaxID=3380645 RepID=UPI0038BD0F26
MQPNLTQDQHPARSAWTARTWAGILLFFALAAAGLFWAKWQPYFYKTLTAAKEHSIGKSILLDGSSGIPAPSWEAAWSYSVTYFLAVWKALLVAAILASLVQVLIPRDWISRLLGSTRFASTLRGGLLSLPGMMCTCCAAPIVSGLRKCSSSVGSAAAFWFGNTALNPAVLIFMFFVLGWKFTLLRFVLGVVLVFGVTTLANRLAKDQSVAEPLPTSFQPEALPDEGSFLTRWLKALGKMVFSMTPLYILTVLALGAARAWLFPAMDVNLADSFWLIVVMAVAGTLFVIPTAAEIPIVQSMIAMGLGTGPAAALMITLPVISLPSILLVRKAFPAKVLAFFAVSVIVLGIVAGLIGSLF